MSFDAIIVALLVVASLAYFVRRMYRAVKRESDCGCGCGKSCASRTQCGRVGD